MASPSSHPKTLHLPLHVFSVKSASSSTQVFSSKLKTILQSFIFSHLYRIIRALTKAKSIVIQVLKDIQILQFIQLSVKKNSKNLKNKLFLGCFRLHHNWCSSNVIPAPMPKLEGYYKANHFYYDSSWTTNNVIPSTDSCEELMAGAEDSSSSSQLLGYLKWLEEKDQDNNHQGNEIDRLADMFIANSHEKFRLEKQESYRRFQEMMDRSI
ncbi:hypothetical protein ACH5RR_002651 [Cinchona calisaya]|uniref:Uncharacterized protein n=1 Tax=Cinchona calisaya TaxID=153742 RepID=A0ABD3ASL1_9GENT